MSSVVQVSVPGKVNLSLAVGPVRPDGFHALATVYQAVSLRDRVRLIDRADGRGPRLAVTGRESAAVPTDATNLAWKAAVLAGEMFSRSPDLTIEIDKGIPVAGGMAGGSADAAAVLLGCRALWNPQRGLAELITAAAELGSDVPFPLLGGTAVGTGRGEQVAAALGRGTFQWVAALSRHGLATPQVYRTFDTLHPEPAAPQVSQDVLQAVRSGSPAALAAAVHNDLQPAALALVPELDQLLAFGSEHGALASLVSGSGPTCVFLAADAAAADELAVAVSASGLCRAARRMHGPVAGATVVA